MKNPLKKRYKRELRTDMGKYAVIFLFMVLFIGMVSGFLVSDNSVSHAYYEGFAKYNIEDGHLTFKSEPPQSLLDQLSEENDLTFYKMFYKNEGLDERDIDLRIYPIRKEVNTACLMEGVLPRTAKEIALDRMFADNNHIAVGDHISVRGNRYTVTAKIALPDYSSLFQSNADMMFDAFNFGVGVTTQEGFDRLSDAHLQYNYAWQYHTAPSDETAENSRSEALIDSLTHVLKMYNVALVQAQVNTVFADVKPDAQKLTTTLTDAAKAIEQKITIAGEKAAKEAILSLTEDEMTNAVCTAAGMDKSTLYKKVSETAGLRLRDLQKADSMESLMPSISKATGLGEDKLMEVLLNAALAKKNTTMEALTAEELGTTEQALLDLQSAFQDAESLTGAMDFSAPPVIDPDGENPDLDFSLDNVYAVLDKVVATGLYDVTDIRKSVDALAKKIDFTPDESGFVNITDYCAKYQNRAITFTGEDMQGDKASIQLFTYIVMVILAFVFAVTTSNTIQKEAAVIGTLRASGYSRGELVRHYLFLPVVVTLIAAVVGNILGYTVFQSFFVKVYYSNYSLCTYETLWNLDAFKETTLIPMGIMIVINLILLTKKMRTPPLAFLRGETTMKYHQKAVKLSEKMPFLMRFRLRILFQNIPAYVVLFFGIVIGATICVFGTMFGPLCEDYIDLVRENQIAQYQYILTQEKEITDTNAERFSFTSLDSAKKGYVTDTITVYGLAENSRYVEQNIPHGRVLVSNGLAEKYGLHKGDTLTLKEKYSAKTYDFTVDSVYNYPGALSVFLPAEDFKDTFDDALTGYFSHTELTELTEDDIAGKITVTDLTKVATQLGKSMGEMMNLFKYFGIIIFVLLMFLLTKQIIDKNARSISMTKILGFADGEIGRLYLVSTGVVVVASLLLSIRIIDALLHWAFTVYLYKVMSGYIPYIISDSCYIFMIVAGIVSYIFVSLVMCLRIRKVKKGEILKNQM